MRKSNIDNISEAVTTFSEALTKLMAKRELITGELFIHPMDLVKLKTLNIKDFYCFDCGELLIQEIRKTGKYNIETGDEKLIIKGTCPNQRFYHDFFFDFKHMEQIISPSFTFKEVIEDKNLKPYFKYE